MRKPCRVVLRVVGTIPRVNHDLIIPNCITLNSNLSIKKECCAENFWSEKASISLEKINFGNKLHRFLPAICIPDNFRFNYIQSLRITAYITCQLASIYFFWPLIFPGIPGMSQISRQTWHIMHIFSDLIYIKLNLCSLNNFNLLLHFCAQKAWRDLFSEIAFLFSKPQWWSEVYSVYTVLCTCY